MTAPIGVGQVRLWNGTIYVILGLVRGPEPRYVFYLSKNGRVMVWPGFGGELL